MYLAYRVKDLENREESAHQLRSMKRKRKFFSKKVLQKGRDETRRHITHRASFTSMHPLVLNRKPTLGLNVKVYIL